MKLSKKQIEAIQFYKLGNLDEAVNCFELSTNDNINNELVYESLGICYMETGKYQKSIKIIDKRITVPVKVAAGYYHSVVVDSTCTFFFNLAYIL